MEGFGIPQQDYKMYHGEATFSRKREEWKRTICGEARPKYERAQILGHVVAMRRYKSRAENERWGYQKKISTEQERYIRDRRK